MRFTFIDTEKAKYPVTTLCRVLDVSESGYYYWKNRPPSKRATDNERIMAHIHAEYNRSRRTYGSPRLTLELNESGIKTGRQRVARLMQKAGICARKPPRFKKTTDSNHDLPRAPNLVERRFENISTAPNKLWVSDLTYIRT